MLVIETSWGPAFDIDALASAHGLGKYNYQKRGGTEYVITFADGTVIEIESGYHSGSYPVSIKSGEFNLNINPQGKVWQLWDGAPSDISVLQRLLKVQQIADGLSKTIQKNIQSKVPVRDEKRDKKDDSGDAVMDSGKSPAKDESESEEAQEIGYEDLADFSKLTSEPKEYEGLIPGRKTKATIRTVVKRTEEGGRQIELGLSRASNPGDPIVEVDARARTKIGPDARHVSPIIWPESALTSAIPTQAMIKEREKAAAELEAEDSDEDVAAESKDSDSDAEMDPGEEADTGITTVRDTRKFILSLVESLVDDREPDSKDGRTKNQIVEEIFAAFAPDIFSREEDEDVSEVEDLMRIAFTEHSIREFINFPTEGSPPPLEAEGPKIKEICKTLNKYEWMLSTEESKHSARLESLNRADRAAASKKSALSKEDLNVVIKGIFDSFDYRALDPKTKKSRDAEILSAVQSKSHLPPHLKRKNPTGGSNKYNLAVSSRWRSDDEPLSVLYTVAARHLELVFLMCPNLQERYQQEIIAGFLARVCADINSARPKSAKPLDVSEVQQGVMACLESRGVWFAEPSTYSSEENLWIALADLDELIDEALDLKYEQKDIEPLQTRHAQLSGSLDKNQLSEENINKAIKEVESLAEKLDASLKPLREKSIFEFQASQGGKPDPEVLAKLRSREGRGSVPSHDSLPVSDLFKEDIASFSSLCNIAKQSGVDEKIIQQAQNDAKKLRQDFNNPSIDQKQTYQNLVALDEKLYAALERHQRAVIAKQSHTGSRDSSQQQGSSHQHSGHGSQFSDVRRDDQHKRRRDDDKQDIASPVTAPPTTQAPSNKSGPPVVHMDVDSAGLADAKNTNKRARTDGPDTVASDDSHNKSPVSKDLTSQKKSSKGAVSAKGPSRDSNASPVSPAVACGTFGFLGDGHGRSKQAAEEIKKTKTTTAQVSGIVRSARKS